MTTHPNRSRARDRPDRTPAPKEIAAAREAAGLTQTAAADLLHTSCRSWQQWEAGDRRLHPAFWELFRIKVESLTAGDSAADRLGPASGRALAPRRNHPN